MRGNAYCVSNEDTKDFSVPSQMCILLFLLM